jgi:hypothetical protein
MKKKQKKMARLWKSVSRGLTPIDPLPISGNIANELRADSWFLWSFWIPLCRLSLLRWLDRTVQKNC